MQHPNEPGIASRGSVKAGPCCARTTAAKAISAISAPKAGNVACGYLSLRSRQTTRPSV